MWHRPSMKYFNDCVCVCVCFHHIQVFLEVWHHPRPLTLVHLELVLPPWPSQASLKPTPLPVATLEAQLTLLLLHPCSTLIPQPLPIQSN